MSDLIKENHSALIQKNPLDDTFHNPRPTGLLHIVKTLYEDLISSLSGLKKAPKDKEFFFVFKDQNTLTRNH